MTRYDSEADAQNGTNGTEYEIETRTNGSNSTLPDARDASIYANTDTNEFVFSTAWYFTPPNAPNQTAGYGNPNNSNNGFVQIYDLDGSSLTGLSGGFNPSNTEFSLSATGALASGDEYARLWAPPADGAANVTAGTFLDYSLDLTAGFGSPAPGGVYNYEIPQSLSGSFNGLFENTGSDSSLNGFYTVSLLFQSGSGAQDGNYVYYPSGNTFAETSSAYFADPAPVPLPAALPMLAGALGGLALWRRRAAA